MKNNINDLTGISDASIVKATGKSWEGWMQFLDSREAGKLSHKEIVSILSQKIENSWWCQAVAVGYEKYKGKRVLGQTADSKFQVGVTKTLNIAKDKLWEVLCSKEGMEIWLGKTDGPLPKSPTRYQTATGIRGEITILKHGSHFRMTWQPEHWPHKSVLQVRTIPKKEKSVLSFHHEGLTSREEREKMKAYWIEKTEELMKLIEQ